MAENISVEFGMRFTQTSPMRVVLIHNILRVAALFSLLIVAPPHLATGSASPGHPEINVEQGRIIGRSIDGLHVFKGVPFSQPPTGALRWAPPQKPPPFEKDIEAVGFGPACPQGNGNTEWYGEVARYFGQPPSKAARPEEISEDCLYLNIWALAQSRNAPVMVWVYGGSNVNGYAHEPNYLGGNLARKGVVVVTFNYRLGPLGFMAHPLLSEGQEFMSGHYGLMDIVMALNWVKANIRSVGGNPGNVTVFGESAGGANIVALMHAPKAKGLFHRAIIQSGALGPGDMNPPGRALAHGQAFFSSLAAEQRLDGFREINWQTLEKRRQDLEGSYYHGPIIDGRFLVPEIVNPVPAIIGSNLDEWRMYLGDDLKKETAEALEHYYKPELDLGLLRKLHPSEEVLADRLITAAEFLCPSRQLARALGNRKIPNYVYLFSRVRAGGSSIGAYHGAEIPYVFGTHDDWLPTHGIDHRLSREMQDAWVAFAHGREPWRQYSPDGVFMSFEDAGKIKTGHGDLFCQHLIRTNH